MKQESTQYGLKNHLKAIGLEKLGANLCRVDLENKKAQKVYLFIQFFSEDIVRFHYSFDNSFEITSPNPHLEFADFDLDQDHISYQLDYTIKTKSLVIEISPHPLSIKIYDHNYNLLSADETELGFWSKALNQKTLNPQSPIPGPSHEVRCYKKYHDLKNPPAIYGLGDKTGSINRWGRRFRNEPIDALGYDSEFTDPLYKDIPFFIHLDQQTKLAHGIFFDNFHAKFFDFGLERKPSPYYYFGAHGGELNYYFINGPEIKSVVSRYLDLTGKAPQWPNYTFGYLASGMSYTENRDVGSGKREEGSVASKQGHCEEQGDEAIQSNNAAGTLIEKFKEFKQDQSPATAFHLSSGYVQAEDGKRYQFIWSEDKFPDPKAFAEEARKEGVELCVNLKPVLLTTHPWYQEACDKDLFINKADGSTLVVDYWGGEGSYMDFRKEASQTWWKEKIKTSFFENGIFGIWNDNNEYEIFEEHQAQGHEHEMSLLMSKLSWEAYQEFVIARSEDRKCRITEQSRVPWILSRSGYSGIQKYAQTWIGDNYSSWKSLQYDNAILASMGLSGLVHAGTDIGGFWGDSPDSELLLRWIQNGVFTPRFCIHSYKEIPTEANMFAESHPEHFKIMQKFFKIREELIPYLEEQSNKAAEQGIPIMRPLVYDFQDDSNTFNQSFEYMFGDKYLVAPIYEPNAKTRKIYLPQGCDWVHYFSQKKYQGGQSIEIDVSDEDIPVFQKYSPTENSN